MGGLDEESDTSKAAVQCTLAQPRVNGEVDLTRRM